MIYFIGTIYRGKNLVSKITSFVAKKNKHKLPFTHSAMLLKHEGKWKVLEITTKGFQEHNAIDYIASYHGDVYYGSFKKIAFKEKECDVFYQVFKQEEKENQNKYDYYGAGNSFRFKTQPWAFIFNNTLGKYLNYKDKKTQGTFCSALTFATALSTIYSTLAVIDFTKEEQEFLKSKTTGDNFFDPKQIYPAEMSDVFDMKILDVNKLYEL
jgi:hypothetical protein